MTSTGNDETQTEPKKNAKKFLDDDDSSELSELDDDEDDNLVDSEAETERLEEDNNNNNTEEQDSNNNNKRKIDEVEDSPKKRKLENNKSHPSEQSLDEEEEEIAQNDADNEMEEEHNNEGDDEEEEIAAPKDNTNPEQEEEKEQDNTNNTNDKKAKKNKNNDPPITPPIKDSVESEKQRKEAISLLTEIEVDFAKLRDKLYQDKMARFVAEIEMCMDGTHPELTKVSNQIENIRNEKVRLASLQRDYQRKCIDNQTRASRDQLHQQYLKDVADTRNKLLTKTTQQWYGINKERRSMDTLVPDFTYKIPEKRSTQLKDRQRIHDEVSYLMGLADSTGFPTAPDITSMQEDEIEDDLFALGLR